MLIFKVKRKRKFFYSICLTVFGLTLMFMPMTYRFSHEFIFQLFIKNKTNAVFYQEPIIIDKSFNTPSNIISNYPTRIAIPKYNVDIDIKLAKLINGVWEVNNDSANFGIGSSLPGETGNTVIFAHARDNLFGSLIYVKEGDLVAIQTKDGNWYNYKVNLKKEVEPNQTELVSQTSDKRLTLFTCSGFTDSKRLIITASLLN